MKITATKNVENSVVANFVKSRSKYTVVAKSLQSPLNFEDFHFYLIYGSNQKQKSF